VLLATTGMRRGEMLGLRWSDVDLEHQQLAVVNTPTTVNYRPILSTPKTERSRRVIYLDPATIDVLQRHQANQQTERVAAGADWYHEIDFVFRDEFGQPLHPEWFTREFRPRGPDLAATDRPPTRFKAHVRHQFERRRAPQDRL
jgi:integrase